MEEKHRSSNLVIKSFNSSYCVLEPRAWHKSALQKCTSRNIWYKIFCSFQPLLLRHEHIYLLSLCSYIHWLLRKCQRPHQKPLLLRSVVAGPSKAPHYWLMEPHQLHSIKTQHQPHAVVSPGLSELRFAAAHQGLRLLMSSDTKTEQQRVNHRESHQCFTRFCVNYFFKYWLMPHLRYSDFGYERCYTNKSGFWTLF